MESIDSIEAYANRSKKDRVSEKKEVECNNIIKRYQKWLRLVVLHKRTDSGLATSSRSAIKTINDWRFWIWKTKYIA